MTYNVEGSPYYLIAQKLKQIFEERYAKTVRDEGAFSRVRRLRAAPASPSAMTPSPHPPLAPADEAVEAARAPALMDKKMFSQNIYNISSEDLGRVVHILDQRCDACIKKIDPEDIEIDIDAIDAATFWTVDAFVKECLPGAKRSASGKKPAAASSTAAAASSAAPAKKARVA